MIKKALIISLKFFLFFTVLTGVMYPLIVAGLAQIIFPGKSNGSLIIQDNKTVGSALIGQQFDSMVYFTSRPSAISYNPVPSGASNYALTNKKLKELVNRNQQQFISFNRLNEWTDIPAEMLFTSASGLDPHISPKAALLQVDRIAKARSFDTVQKQKIIECVKALTEPPQFFCVGEERICVLTLNLELNKIDRNIINYR
jgi:potassium-transporting ATPase KdpC subunit